jgi:environmental stress-induced protein Ves
MPSLIAIPRSKQRDEPWANGAGSTTVILREPDSAEWRVRVSVARVDHPGPFSELPQTRRELVPLDAAMTLRFPDGHALHAARMHAVQFAGSPAPCGVLPEGPTRDFNLMLRGDARGTAIARTLAGSMLLPPEPGSRWLVYLDNGRATVSATDAPVLDLAAGDAVLVIQLAGSHAHIEGAGEIALVKLYA